VGDREGAFKSSKILFWTSHAALAEHEVLILLDILRIFASRHRQHLISHKLDEVSQSAIGITVLRDGRP